MRNKKIIIPTVLFLLVFAIILVIQSKNIMSIFKAKTQIGETQETQVTQESEKLVISDIIEETVEETKEVYISPIDFETLRQQNEDIVGWVKIPDTKIDYPILWNGDNDFYLHHDVDRNPSVYGAIFLDGENNKDFNNKHNILYGHHMRDKSMFQNIVLFKNEDFFKENRNVYVYTPEKMYHLRTIACLYTDASGEKRQMAFEDAKDFGEYIDKMTLSCEFRELPDMEIDKLWSFITCSYEFDDARTILYCYEVED